MAARLHWSSLLSILETSERSTCSKSCHARAYACVMLVSLVWAGRRLPLTAYSTNRQQFSMVCTLIDHKNDVKMFKTQSVTTSRKRTFWRHFHCWEEYRAFSLTRPACMKIYWNKRKRLRTKRVQIPHDWFGTPIWPPWRHVQKRVLRIVLPNCHYDDALIQSGITALSQRREEACINFIKRDCLSSPVLKPLIPCVSIDRLYCFRSGERVPVRLVPKTKRFADFCTIKFQDQL